MTGRQNVSQLTRTTTAKIRKRLFGEPIESARLGVSLDLFIEMRRLEFLKPRAESGELIGGQLGNGFFDSFKGRHGGSDST